MARYVPRNTPIALPDRLARRALRLGLLFVTVVLVVNALVGERGFFASLAARRAYHRLATEMDAITVENERLRTTARRLRHDPNAIEALARQELGLIRPGETVFLLHDDPNVSAEPE